MSSNESMTTSKSTQLLTQKDDIATSSEPVKTHKFQKKILELKANFKRRERAVILIQRVWRGFVVRRSLPSIKEKVILKQQQSQQANEKNIDNSKQRAMSIINKAIYSYILKKRALQEDFIKKYIKYAAVTIQRYYRGFRVRKACNVALQRTRKFQSFILSFLKGWKTRRIIQHTSIACVVREIQDLEKIKNSISLQECENERGFWADIPVRLKKKKYKLIENFYKLYSSGTWVVRSLKSSPSKAHLSKSCFLKTIQESVPVHKQSVLDLSLNLNKNTPIANNENSCEYYFGQRKEVNGPFFTTDGEISFKGNTSDQTMIENETPNNFQSKINQWERRHNNFIGTNGVSTLINKGLNQPSSEKQLKTPDKKDYLRRNPVRYDPRKSAEQSKEIRRTLEQERSQNVSSEQRDDSLKKLNTEAKESSNLQSKSPAKKISGDSLSTSSRSNLGSKKELERCKTEQIVKCDEQTKANVEKEAHTRESRFSTSRKSSFASLQGKQDDKSDNKNKKSTGDIDNKIVESAANLKNQKAINALNEKPNWKAVPSRVSCWKGTHSRKVSQDASKSSVKDLTCQGLPAPSSTKSPLRMNKQNTEKPIVHQKPKLPPKKEEVKNLIAPEVRRTKNLSVSKMPEKVVECRNTNLRGDKTPNKNRREENLVSFEGQTNESVNIIPTDKNEKRGFKSFSLSEARAQRRKNNSMSHSQIKEPDFKGKFKELDNSFDKGQIAGTKTSLNKVQSAKKNTKALAALNEARYEQLREIFRANCKSLEALAKS